MKSHEDLVRTFWRLFNDAKFDEAGNLLSPDCTIRWPNTRELFRNRDTFIKANKNYPGRWFIEIEKIFLANTTVISVVRVYNKEDNLNFYATSFFTIVNNVITEIIEYWGENTEPPDWRVKEGLSERY